MKKFLLLAAVALTSLMAGAQGAQKIATFSGAIQKQNVSAPKMFAAPAKAAAHKVALGDGIHAVGYYEDADLPRDEDGDIVTAGLPQYPGSYTIYGCVPVSALTKYPNAKMVGMRFGLGLSIGATTVEVRPVDAQGIYDAVRKVNVESTQPGWNTVMFDEPFDINPSVNEYVLGYSYKQVNSNNGQYYNAECFPICLVDSDVEDGCILYGTPLNNPLGYYNITGGLLCVQALITCDELPAHDMVLKSFTLDGTNLTAGETYNFYYDMLEFGAEDTQTCELELRLDGNLLGTYTEEEVAHSTLSYMNPFTVPADIAPGAHELTLTITKVNGEALTVNTEDDVLSLDVNVFSANDIVARDKYLVEEFTSTYCTYCPLGAQLMHTMEGLFPEMTLVAVHENMSGTDPYRTTETEAVMSYVGAFSNDLGFPSASLNRINFGGQEGLVVGLGYPASQHKQMAEQLKAIMKEYSPVCFSSVNVEATFSEDMKSIDIKVTGEGGDRVQDFLSNCGLTVYVIENGIIGRQLDNGTWKTSYQHDNVLRKVASNVKGDAIKYVSNTAFENTYSVAVGSAWNTENLEVVAFINQKGTGADERGVVNANRCKVVTAADAEGINGVAVDGAVAPVYDLSGRIVNATNHGIFVKNGKKIVR